MLTLVSRFISYLTASIFNVIRIAAFLVFLCAALYFAKQGFSALFRLEFFASFFCFAISCLILYRLKNVFQPSSHFSSNSAAASDDDRFMKAPDLIADPQYQHHPDNIHNLDNMFNDHNKF